MTWRAPEHFGYSPWSVLLAEGVAFAMTGDDGVKLVIGVLGALGLTGVGAMGAWSKLKGMYDASNAGQLTIARRHIAENTAKIEELEASNAVLKAENQSLRTKLAERDRVIDDRDKTIADRDAAIKLRDQAIEEHMRFSKRLGAATANIAETLLILKGDVKSKGA